MGKNEIVYSIMCIQCIFNDVYSMMPWLSAWHIIHIIKELLTVVSKAMKVKTMFNVLTEGMTVFQWDH